MHESFSFDYESEFVYVRRTNLEQAEKCGSEGNT